MSDLPDLCWYVYRFGKAIGPIPSESQAKHVAKALGPSYVTQHQWCKKNKNGLPSLPGEVVYRTTKIGYATYPKL